MRIRFLLPLLASLLLAACQAVDETHPPAHASIATSHVDTGGDRIDTFLLASVDGRPILTYTDEPSKTLGKDSVVAIPAGRTVRIEIEGLARYGNSFRSLFWNPMRAEGRIEFVPAPDSTYTVRGEISPAGSSVWLEDDKTHEVVVRKIQAPATGAAEPGPLTPEQEQKIWRAGGA